MRIISGVAKGKKIKLPVNKKTRPLKDMVRESIFNIIEHSNLFELGLDKSYVLDLFSGVGSFGLEAISRGVKKVFFLKIINQLLNCLKKIYIIYHLQIKLKYAPAMFMIKKI